VETGGGKEPSIGGAPLSSFMSEDLMMWYLAEVKSGRETNWYLFFMSLGMRPFDAPTDSALQRKYARLKKAGVSKEAILMPRLSSGGHKLFNANMIFFGMVFTTIALAPFIGGILGGAMLALLGGAPRLGFLRWQASSSCASGPHNRRGARLHGREGFEWKRSEENQRKDRRTGQGILKANPHQQNSVRDNRY